MTDHNAHVYAFWSQPLHKRVAWSRLQLAQANARLAAGGYPSADAYYADKDWARRLSAALVGKKPHEHDPMGFWFGMQSN